MTLIGYWPLNETEGDTAYDYSGNENHGRLENSPTQSVEGVLGQTACEFDGENYVAIPSEDYQSPEAFTLCGWVNILEFGSSGSDWVPLTPVMDDGDGSSNIGLWYETDDIKIRSHFDFDGSSDHHTESFNLVSSGEWNFYVAVWTGEESIIYYNGEIVGKANRSGNLIEDSSEVWIGSGWPSDVRERPPSIQMEQRIYNRALTASEVQYLYNVGRRGRFTSTKKQP